MKNKLILITALVGALAVGGATAAHAATSQGWFKGSPVCQTDQMVVAVHFTGKTTADGGGELRFTLKDGSTCLSTTRGETITAEHKSRGG